MPRSSGEPTRCRSAAERGESLSRRPARLSSGGASPLAHIAPRLLAFWPLRRVAQLLPFQSIAPGNHLEFATNRFLDRDDGSRLEYEGRKHRTKLVYGHRIVAFHQHMPTPLADSYHEEFNLEIGGGLPLAEYLEDSLLGVLVLDGRTLRAFRTS